MTCGHEIQHPLFGLPFVCTRDEHGGDTGHHYEWCPVSTSDTIAVSLAEFAAEAEYVTRLRDNAIERFEYSAYKNALSMLHRLSGGKVGAALQDQPGWDERQDSRRAE